MSELRYVRRTISDSKFILREEAASRELELVRETIPLRKLEYSLEKKRIANNKLVLQIEKTKISTEEEKSRRAEIELITEKERTQQIREQNRNIELQIEMEKIKRRSGKRV